MDFMLACGRGRSEIREVELELEQQRQEGAGSLFFASLSPLETQPACFSPSPEGSKLAMAQERDFFWGGVGMNTGAWTHVAFLFPSLL